MSNTAKGGLIGGGAGAAVGAAAGGGKGALIGGLAGGLIGGAVGNDMDQQEKRRMENRLAVAESRPVGPPLGITDVVQLSRQGLSDGVIINQIRATGSTFQLSVEDIRMMKSNNVSDVVIAEMQNRPPVRYARPAPVVYYDYPPPPPPRASVGVIYAR
jgi:surface antigen